MQQLGSQLEVVLNDLRQAVTDAGKETRQYNKTSSNNYKPDAARYKLVIWFKDGNRRTFYSYDHVYHNKIVHLDEFESFMKLFRLKNKYEGTFKNAIIYATLDPARSKESNYNIVMSWTKINGENVMNSAGVFRVIDKDNLLYLERLDLYSGKNFRTNK
jgi:hypothetical protein